MAAATEPGSGGGRGAGEVSPSAGDPLATEVPAANVPPPAATPAPTRASADRTKHRKLPAKAARAPSKKQRGAPVGAPTRGTTNPNRLRRVDRWLVADPTITRLLRRSESPLVVDLGYGASPVTTVELARWLPRVRADVRVLGLELDPERVERAQSAADPPRLDFRRGGFELAGARPVLVRAFNVLRQYAEHEVTGAWQLILDAMPAGGLLVEGTCDEIGRLASWVTVTAGGPVSLTLSLRLAELERPSTVAERLPKILIHRNVPGERVHTFLTTLDECWATAAPQRAFGVRARWSTAVTLLADRGWPVLSRPDRHRLGELTVPWTTVAPGLTKAASNR